MDTGYTFGSPSGERLALYVPPRFQPPESVTVTHEGRPVEFVRLSDRELDCGAVDGVQGVCTSFECHRQRLGFCQCGRHHSVHDSSDDPRPSIRLRKAGG